MSRSSSYTNIKPFQQGQTPRFLRPIQTRPAKSSSTSSSKPNKVSNEEGFGDSKGHNPPPKRMHPLSLPSNVRRQRSDPVLSRTMKPKVENSSFSPFAPSPSVQNPPAKIVSSTGVAVGVASIEQVNNLKKEESASPSSLQPSPMTASVATASAYSFRKPNSEEEPICEGLKNDAQLRALCTSIGLSLHPETLVGPIEKGQLIIGVLQDSINELINIKLKNAEKTGIPFQIQQTGLDLAIRALEHADRSLKNMKAKANKSIPLQKSSSLLFKLNTLQQRKQEALLQHQRQSQAVIKILSTTKEKFDKMGNGLDKFMNGLSFLSMSSSSSRSSTAAGSRATTAGTGVSYSRAQTFPYRAASVSVTAASSRRTTGISVIAAPPATPITTRVRTSNSSISVASRGGRGKNNTQSFTSFGNKGRMTATSSSSAIPY